MFDRTSNSTKTMADVLFLPEVERSLVNWLLRQQNATLAEIAAYITKNTDDTLVILEGLIAQGFVKSIENEGDLRYQTCLVGRKKRGVSDRIWNALEEDRP
jgi:ribosomal protein S8